MRIALTLVAEHHLALQAAIPHALEAAALAGTAVGDTQLLGEGAVDLLFENVDPSKLRNYVGRALERQPVDFCVQPATGRKKRLLVADMDSTIIGCECLDELADFAGLKAQIAAITQRAMAGEIEFEAALIERVGKLAGLPLTALQRTYDERVRLNPGAAILARTMRANGARCALVSGGFEFFTRRVAAAAGFDTQHANRLIDDGANLTGEVEQPILGRQAKLAVLNQEAAGLRIGLDETLAVGDGANDLAMIEAAGLGIAYRAKSVVAAHADARVDHTDLTTLLYFQGYGADEFRA